MKNKKLSWLMTIMFICFSGSLSAQATGSSSIVNRTPFQFPLTNMYQEMTTQSDFYTYTLDSVRGAVTVDGDIEEVSGKEAFMAEYVVPASGHPAGTIYAWVMNDAENLYITFDVTPDNTMDGNEDYVKAYIKTSDGLKLFKVSLLNTTWGVPGFRVTERANYEHKVYELKIPFGEIGLADGQLSLEIAFSAYGTMAAPPPATFEAAAAYYSGGQPYGIVTGKFNDDNYPDIVAVNANEDTLTVLPNDGDGTFGTGVKTTAPGSPTSVIACNLNGDAYDDLVVCSSSGTYAFLSTGNNLFSSLIPCGAGYSAAVGDFNKDGFADVATTDWNQDKIFIYQNDKTGHFTMVQEISPGDYPDQIIAADFNKDGKQDLAVVMGDRFTVSTMQIRFGYANGTFPSDPSTVISDIGEVNDAEGWYTAGGATAADFNGDGNIDIAFVYFDQYLDFTSYPEYASILFGDGAGNFQFPDEYVPPVYGWTDLSLNYGPVDSIAGDFNDDGYIDLAVANRYSKNLSILDNAVNVQLIYKNDIALTKQPAYLTSGDFNQDGLTDIALTNFDDGNALVLINSTGGSKTGACRIDGVYYDTLADALAGVISGDTITLLDDITYSSNIWAGSGYYPSLTLDLSGHRLEISGAEVPIAALDGYDINVTDSSSGGALVLETTFYDSAPTGIAAHGLGSSVIVDNKVTTTITAWGSGSKGISARDGGLVEIGAGSITSGTYGISAYGKVDDTASSVGFTGNVTALSDNGFGVHATDGGSITVIGNVSETGSGGIGAYAGGSTDGGEIIIDGAVTAEHYTFVGSDYKELTDYSTPTTKLGYLTYSDGTSSIWVDLFSGGTGTLEDPYILSSEDDLIILSHLAADGDDIADRYFEQSGDIALTKTWVPIKDFNGTYDGNLHAVSGLTFSSHVDYVGFFANTGSSAGLKNIVLNDVTFTNAYLYAGALVGYSGGGTISNCSVHNIYITGDSYVGGLIGYGYQTSINNCHADGEIEGGYYTGGLVGRDDYGSIISSNAAVGVIGNNDDTGGLVGYNHRCDITNCYATGSVEGNYRVGGLIGYNEYYATITNCYATGNVMGSPLNSDYLGGLIGYNDNHSTVFKCYSRGNVTGDVGVGGLAGYNSTECNITECYTTGTVTGNVYTSPLVGYSYGTLNKCYYLDKMYEDESSTALTPIEMVLQSSFIDWDFETWQIGLDSAYDYPTLKGLGGSIRSSSYEGFGISPDGLVILAAGVNQTYSIEPDSGYRIVDVVIDGETVGALSSYTFINVQTSHKISVSVEETASTDATLSALTASGITLTPAFSSGTISYSANVANSVSSTTVSVTPSNNAAGVSISGTVGTSKEVPLSVGSNTVTVIVTAEDGVTTKTYTVTITRAAATTGGGGDSTPTGKPVTVSTPDGGTTVTGTLQESGNTEQVTIDKTKFETLAGAGSGAVIPLPFATVTFDAKAIDAIEGASSTGNVVLTVEKLDPKTLTAQQQKLIGDRPVYDFTIEKGGTKISHFDGGHAEISIPYTLSPGEDPNQVVIYYLTEDGTLKPVRGHYDAASKCVVFKTTHFSAYGVGYNPVSFGDVAAGVWYKAAIDFIAAREITSGTSDGEFSPEATLTRGQFIVLLMNAYGISPEPVTDGTANFADAGSTYYTDYLLAAKSLGIVNGVGDNMYAPGQAITRQEMFVMLHNALEVIGELPGASGAKQLSQFGDADQVAPWAKEAMSALINGGVISGSNGMLHPTASATRGEMAQMLYNLLAK